VISRRETKNGASPRFRRWGTVLDCSGLVVRGRVELPTFRFSGQRV
jgi:hypothetical protein